LLPHRKEAQARTNAQHDEAEHAQRAACSPSSLAGEDVAEQPSRNISPRPTRSGVSRDQLASTRASQYGLNGSSAGGNGNELQNVADRQAAPEHQVGSARERFTRPAPMKYLGALSAPTPQPPRSARDEGKGGGDPEARHRVNDASNHGLSAFDGAVALAGPATSADH
jgi:hypothetical protein